MSKKIDRKAIEALYMQGFTDIEIAAELGCGSHVPAKWRKENGLPPNVRLFDWQQELCRVTGRKYPRSIRPRKRGRREGSMRP